MNKIHIIKRLSLHHLLYRVENGKDRYMFQHARVVKDALREHGLTISSVDVQAVLTKSVRQELINHYDDKEAYYKKLQDQVIQEDGSIREDYVDIKVRTVNDINTETLEVLAYLSPDIVKTEEYVLELMGYPIEEWTISSHKRSNWGKTTDANGKELHYYAYNFTLKRKTANDMILSDYIKFNKEYELPEIPVLRKVSKNKKETEKIGVWHITDVHFGSKYSLGHNLPGIAEKLCSMYDNDDLDTLVVALTGDILHVDNIDKQTAKGTFVDLDMTPYEMYDHAKDNIIKTLGVLGRQFDNIQIYWVQGNHSRIFEYGLLDAIKEHFRKNKHMTFHVDPTRRKAFEYGKNIVGFNHGDIKDDRQTGWLPNDFAELWGRTKHREILSGHIHKNRLYIDETNGVVVRTPPPIKNRDDYEYAEGYIESRPVTLFYTYHRNFGMTRSEYI